MALARSKIAAMVIQKDVSHYDRRRYKMLFILVIRLLLVSQLLIVNKKSYVFTIVFICLFACPMYYKGLI
jgi:hypothetical protein